MKERLEIILLLELTIGCLLAEMRDCSESVPAICMNNRNIINITKARDHYKLQLCSSNGCIPGEQEKWIRCDKMCDTHKLISSDTTNCNNCERCCERQVMSFLGSYCSTNTRSTRTTITMTSTHNISVIETVTLSPSCTMSVSNQYTLKSTLSSAIIRLLPKTAEQANEINATSLTTLGVFLCLIVIALIVVTIGWLLTYWTMKKKLSQKARYKLYTCTTRLKISMTLYNDDTMPPLK